MPRISVWLVRCALLHLMGGFTLGALLLMSKGEAWMPVLMPLRPLHVEMLLVGWMVQLAFGVGSWILPYGRGVDNDWRLYAALGCINAGVALMGCSILWPDVTWLPPLARSAEIGAAGLFGWHIWPRVRALPQRVEH
jgi:hypothetical protein